MQETDLAEMNTAQMPTVRASRVVFALVLIGLGIIGFAKFDLAPGWSPVPQSVLALSALIILCDLVYFVCGIGLLGRRTATFAARILFIYLLLWLLVLRLPWVAIAPQVGTWWPAGSTAVLLGSSWVLYSSLARQTDFIAGPTGIRIARILFGLGLIPFGIAHFLFPEATAPLVPGWMLWPLFWAYFTGTTFIAAGFGIIFGVFARLAAALMTVQLAMLTVLVWVPMVIGGNLTPFQLNEFFVSILLTAAAWVMADSYREIPWLVTRKS